MNASHYNPNAQTPEEHLSNCQFQLDNVSGWLLVENIGSAEVKAQCLLEAAQKLVKSFKGKVANER